MLEREGSDFLPSDEEEEEVVEVTSHPTSRCQPYLLVMRFLQGHDRLLKKLHPESTVDNILRMDKKS